MANSRYIEQAGYAFNIYDIFGHLIPGAVLVSGFLLADHLLTKSGGLVVGLCEELPCFQKSNLENGQWWWAVVAIIFSVLVIYLMGLLVNSMASLFIDRILVRRLNGYPYERLFENILPVTREHYTRPYNRAAHFVFWCLFIVAIICPFFHDSGKLQLFVLFAAGGSAIVLWVVIFVVKRRAQRGVHDTPLGLRTINGKEVNWRKPGVLPEPETTAERFVFLLSEAERWCTKRLFNLIRIMRPFKPPFQRKVDTLFQNKFGLVPGEVRTDFFGLVVLSVAESSKTWKSLLLEARRLYTLIRNLCIAFLVLSVYGAVLYGYKGSTNESSRSYALWAVITVGGAFAWIIRYYLIYAGHYTKSAFRSFMLAETEEEKKEKRPKKEEPE